MQCRRHPADVPAIARRHQGQQSDGGVFCGVQRSGESFVRNSAVLEQLRGDGVHDGSGVESLCGHVEFDGIENLAREEASEIADNLMSDVHLHQCDSYLAVVDGFVHRGDRDVGDLASRGVPLGLLRVDQCETGIEIEFVDHERLTLVNVNGPRVGGGGSAAAVDGAQHAAGLAVDDGHLHPGAAANVHRTVRRELLALGRDEPPVRTLAHVAFQLELFENRFRVQLLGLDEGDRQFDCRAQ